MRAIGCALLVGGVARAQTVWFVDASRAPGGDGLSWSSAFDRLQAALSASVAGDQIWVAHGIYKPTVAANPSDARTANFVLPNGCALYGGFAGDEATLAQRARLFAATILDGDIGIPGDPADNSYHVVKLLGGSSFIIATLDGFTIRNGNSVVAGSSSSQGGGVLVTSGGATHGPALTLRNCTIRDNVADTGGGIAVVNLARANLDACRVLRNRATLHGGGMLCQTGLVNSYSTLWAYNSALGDGGAVYSNSTAADWVHFTNDVFRDNVANRGGAIGIAGSQFVRGSADVACSTLAYNRALTGGAIYAETATSQKAQLRLVNSIVWGNTAPSVPQIAGSGATMNVTRNLIDGGFAGFANLNGNPQFIDGARRDLRLVSGSPAADAGDATLVPRDFFDSDRDGLINEFVPTDHEYTRRFTDDPLAPNVGVTFGLLEVVDLGAFER